MVTEVYQTFFANMAETLLQKLTPPPKKHGIDSIVFFTKI